MYIDKQRWKNLWSGGDLKQIYTESRRPVCAVQWSATAVVRITYDRIGVYLARSHHLVNETMDTHTQTWDDALSQPAGLSLGVSEICFGVS